MRYTYILIVVFIMFPLYSQTFDDIIRAMEKGDVAKIEQMLEAHKIVNIRHESGQTPLHYVAAGKWEVWHIDYGVEHSVPEDKQEEIARLLISNNADINAKDEAEWSPLHYAVSRSNTDVAELLIQAGANIEAEDKYGWTPLHVAARWNSSVCAEFLLQNGACVNAETKKTLFSWGKNYLSGSTPLDIALINESVYVIETLKEHNARLHMVKCTDELGKTPLHNAVRVGSLDLVAQIIKMGVDIDVMTNGSQTPLHYAALGGKTDIVEFLLKEGADVNIQDKNGWTSLHYAARNGDEGIVEILINKGAEIDKETTQDVSTGETKYPRGSMPLDIAMISNNSEVVELLIKCGARSKTTGSKD